VRDSHLIVNVMTQRHISRSRGIGRRVKGPLAISPLAAAFRLRWHEFVKSTSRDFLLLHNVFSYTKKVLNELEDGNWNSFVSFTSECRVPGDIYFFGYVS